MSKIESVKLNNGLTIYFYTDKKRHSTFFQHITLFGGSSKDFIVDGKEYHMQDGIAHILEHYIVEANANGNFLKILGEAQMATNASTHYNMTRYYFEAVEKVEFGIKTILKSIYSPIFSSKKLEKIKKPILQEIRGKMGSKFYHSNRKTLDNCFSKIRVRDIGGTLEEVAETTVEDLKICFEAFYQPKNQFIVVGGNFDKDKILKIIKDFYKNLNIKEKSVKLIKMEEPKEVASNKGIVEFPTAKDYLEITYKVNVKSLDIKERLKLDFYLHYFFNMYFGATSNLYKKLVDEKIITTGLKCNDFSMEDYILISVGAYSEKNDLLEKYIRETFLKLESFNEEVFEIDKRESIIRLVLRKENLFDTIMPFVSNIVEFNYPYPDEVSDIETFNFNDFVNTIKGLDFSNSTITLIKNKET